MLEMFVCGAVFPTGFTGIVFTMANLFAGNCMYIVPALTNGDVAAARILAFLVLSGFSNFPGCLPVDYASGGMI